MCAVNSVVCNLIKNSAKLRSATRIKEQEKFTKKNNIAYDVMTFLVFYPDLRADCK